MLYGDFFSNYKNFISYLLVVFNNNCFNNGVDSSAGTGKLEKAYNIIDSNNLETSYHINHINTIFKRLRSKVIKYITDGTAFTLADENNLQLSLRSDDKLNIKLKELYNMCTLIDHDKVTLGETPIYVDKFNYYFLKLLSGCTMADDIKPQIDLKLNELGVKTGILKPEPGSGGPVIFEIFKSITSGDFKNKVNSFLSEDNIETARDISKNILGDNELVDNIINKVKSNASNPIGAITEVFNDDEIMDKASSMIKSIGDNPKVKTAKLRINDITNAITNKIDSIDNDLLMIEEGVENL